MAFTTLETTNFPLYAVNVLDREHFLIAGGGGAAKTGVPNALVCAIAKYGLFSLFCQNILFSRLSWLYLSCSFFTIPLLSNCLRKSGYCLGWRQILFASHFKLMSNQQFLIYIIVIIIYSKYLFVSSKIYKKFGSWYTWSPFSMTNKLSHVKITVYGPQ